jgi:hypothetical protein
MPKRLNRDLINPERVQHFQQLTGQAPVLELEKIPAAVALGRPGGLKRGKARANALSAAKRKEIARKATQVRGQNKMISLQSRALVGHFSPATRYFSAVSCKNSVLFLPYDLSHFAI